MFWLTAPILAGGDRPPLTVFVSPEPTVMIFPMPWTHQERNLELQ
jgi:hypothetical protein